MNLSLPRRLPDLDGDGVDELLCAGAVTLPSGVSDSREHPRTNLVLVSGLKGDVIGRPHRVQSCTELGAVNVTERLEVQFDCVTAENVAEEGQLAGKKYNNFVIVCALIRSKYNMALVQNKETYSAPTVFKLYVSTGLRE